MVQIFTEILGIDDPGEQKVEFALYLTVSACAVLFGRGLLAGLGLSCRGCTAVQWPVPTPERCSVVCLQKTGNGPFFIGLEWQDKLYTIPVNFW